jgi:hypothetical protein
VNWVRELTAPSLVAPAVTKDWAFVGADDNFLRAFDIHSGDLRWAKGLDHPIRTSPWLLGRPVVSSVPAGAEGAPAVRVESYRGFVFVRNAGGLHAFRAASGEDVFRDPDGERPLAMVKDWVVTLDTARQAQLRRGAGLPVVQTLPFGVFDFLPTNSDDEAIVAGFADGVVLLAVPK